MLHLDSLAKNILVYGKTGAGKSAFINYLFGKQLAAVGSGRGSETQQITTYQGDAILCNQNIPIRIIDVPGINDTENFNDYKVINQIQLQLLEGSCQLDAVIMLEQISTDKCYLNKGLSFKLQNIIDLRGHDSQLAGGISINYSNQYLVKKLLIQLQFFPLREKYIEIQIIHYNQKILFWNRIIVLMMMKIIGEYSLQIILFMIFFLRINLNVFRFAGLTYPENYSKSFLKITLSMKSKMNSQQIHLNELTQYCLSYLKQRNTTYSSVLFLALEQAKPLRFDNIFKEIQNAAQRLREKSKQIVRDSYNYEEEVNQIIKVDAIEQRIQDLNQEETTQQEQNETNERNTIVDSIQQILEGDLLDQYQLLIFQKIARTLKCIIDDFSDNLAQNYTFWVYNTKNFIFESEKEMKIDRIATRGRGVYKIMHQGRHKLVIKVACFSGQYQVTLHLKCLSGYAISQGVIYTKSQEDCEQTVMNYIESLKDQTSEPIIESLKKFHQS